MRQLVEDLLWASSRPAVARSGCRWFLYGPRSCQREEACALGSGSLGCSPSMNWTPALSYSLRDSDTGGRSEGQIAGCIYGKILAFTIALQRQGRNKTRKFSLDYLPYCDLLEPPAAGSSDAHVVNRSSPKS